MVSPTEDLHENQLRYFTLAKQQVVELLRTGLQLLHELNDVSGEEQCRALLVRLAEDRFNLAVVGQFKRGKSSLINAIIGRNFLPTGLLPLTSAITTLCYGPQEKVSLKRSGWTLEQEISLSQLPEYVTEEGNPGNIKGVIEVRVELPVPFLRRGLFLVDTPGIGSSHAENKATTYSFLPNSDAVIFVTSVEAPISESEEVFLKDVQQYSRRLFIVVNKIDLLSSDEYAQVVGYIKTSISKILGQPDIRLYPLSARLALQKKLNADNRNGDQRGLEALEADLEKFLAQEKSQMFLVSILDRLLKTLADAASSPHETEIVKDKSQTDLLKLQSSATTLRDAILQGLEALPRPEVVSRSPQEAERLVLSSVQRQQTIAKTRACPICAALSQTTFDFFAQYQYDLVQKSDVRQAFVASKGFCKAHTWQFEKISSPQGISEGYVTLVEKVASELRLTANQFPTPERENIDHLISDRENCLACKLLREEEILQMEKFLEYLTTEDGKEYYRRSLGLCLPHLRKALTFNPPEDIQRFLFLEQARHFEELAEDMHGYNLKRDAIRRDLTNEHEVKAWMYALIQLVGAGTVQNE